MIYEGNGIKQALSGLVCSWDGFGELHGQRLVSRLFGKRIVE